MGIRVHLDRDGDGQLDLGVDPVVGPSEVLGPGDVSFLLVVRVPTWEQDDVVNTTRRRNVHLPRQRGLTRIRSLLFVYHRFFVTIAVAGKG